MLVCSEGNVAVGFNGIRQYNGPLYGDGNSYNLPTQDLYDAFEDNDPRRAATLLDIEAFIASQPNSDDITYAIGGGGHTGYYNNKYIKRLDERGLPDDDLTSPLNYRVIRFADVLLMAAEAFQRTGDDGRARKNRTEQSKGKGKYACYHKFRCPAFGRYPNRKKVGIIRRRIQVF
jgi:starch-binding outer membrane protein, SusD/RagB family